MEKNYVYKKMISFYIYIYIFSALCGGVVVNLITRGREGERNISV